MLISNWLLYFRREAFEHMGECTYGCVCFLASPTSLGFELVAATESSRPKDNPSGLFPYKTYGNAEGFLCFFFFSAHNSY